MSDRKDSRDVGEHIPNPLHALTNRLLYSIAYDRYRSGPSENASDLRRPHGASEGAEDSSMGDGRTWREDQSCTGQFSREDESRCVRQLARESQIDQSWFEGVDLDRYRHEHHYV